LGKAPDLRVDIGPLRLKNPVMLASGIVGYGIEYGALAGVDRMGALVLKTITLAPKQGNPPPRGIETPAGMLNSIGLENPGIEAFIQEKLPQAVQLGVPIIVSIAGLSVAEFAQMAARLDREDGIAAIELNISSPNLPGGGMLFGQDAGMSGEVVAAAKSATRLPVIAKLTPNVTDITAIAVACEQAGADAISLVNTLSGMCIDINTRRPMLGANFGGLSGPAIRPAAVLRIFQVAQNVKVPVIGMGGIWDWRDAAEFIIAGATAVQIGTALFYDPGRGLKVLRGLKRFLKEQGLSTIRELVGTVRLNP